jgi:hypothetical protein
MKFIIAALMVAASEPSCEDSDSVQRDQQEKILAEGTAQAGMPAIKNFRERKLLKDIFELRDQDGLATYTYLFSDYSGRLALLCHSVGYGIPYSTQYTNPQKNYNGHIALPQADPNGLFSPASADGTWVMCLDPHGKDGTKPVFVEPRIVVSPFPLVEPTLAASDELSTKPK